MTDLREHLRSALADEPASAVDPYAAMAAGQRRRAVRHRWWAGVTAAAVLGGVGVGAVALRPTGVPVTGLAVATAPDPQASIEPPDPDCLAATDDPETVPRLPVGFGPISAAYVCELETRTVGGKPGVDVQVLSRLEGDLTELQAVLEQPDAALGDGPCRAYGDLGWRLWVAGSTGLVLTRLPFDDCSHTDDAALKVVEGLSKVELSAEPVQGDPRTKPPSKDAPTKPPSKADTKALERAKILIEEHPCQASQLDAKAHATEAGTQARGEVVELRNVSGQACGLVGPADVRLLGDTSRLQLRHDSTGMFMGLRVTSDPVAVEPGGSAYVYLWKLQCMISKPYDPAFEIEIILPGGSVRAALPARGVGALSACHDPDDSQLLSVSPYQSIGRWG